MPKYRAVRADITLRLIGDDVAIDVLLLEKLLVSGLESQEVLKRAFRDGVIAIEWNAISMCVEEELPESRKCLRRVEVKPPKRRTKG